MKENKAIVQEIWSTSILYLPRDVQGILSSYKISEKYNEQTLFHKKAVFKNFAIFTRKRMCRNLCFNKNAGLKACSFIKRLKHSCFFSNINKFFRTPIFKNICERLLLRVSLELFPTWANNIGSEEDVFSKTKIVPKLSYMKKNCLFMMFFIISFCPISPRRVRRHLPYVIKDDTSESFEAA